MLRSAMALRPSVSRFLLASFAIRKMQTRHMPAHVQGAQPARHPLKRAKWAYYQADMALPVLFAAAHYGLSLQSKKLQNLAFPAPADFPRFPPSCPSENP